MTAYDKVCIVLAFLGLIVLGVHTFRQAYRRAHPKLRERSQS